MDSINSWQVEEEKADAERKRADQEEIETATAATIVGMVGTHEAAIF
jgi:hypothetical protein